MLASLLLSWSAQAEDLRASPIAEGEPAPFAGQVVSTELAIQLGLRASNCDAEIEIKVRRAESLAAIDLDICRQLRSVDRGEYETKEKIYVKELNKIGFSHGIFIGAVSAVLMVIATGYALGELK